MKNNITVILAGIRAKIISNDTHLLRSLANCYGQSSARPHFTVTIEAAVKQNTKSLTAKDWDRLDKITSTTTGSVFRIKTKLAGFEKIGSCDIDRGRCRLNRLPKEVRDFLSAPFLRFCFQVFLFKHNGFILHASAVVKDNKAYVFTGAAGQGKSTIARNLTPEFTFLADELVVIRRINNNYKVFAWGPQGKISKGYKLDKLFFLKKAPDLKFGLIDKPQALWQIYNNILYRPNHSKLNCLILAELEQLCRGISCYQIAFSLASPVAKGLSDLNGFNIVNSSLSGLTAGLAVTSRCNVKCRHCFDHLPAVKDLTFKQIMRRIDYLYDNGAIFLNITGGEPLVRKDLCAILRYAAQKGMAVLISTNGIGIDQGLVKVFKRGNVLRVNLSLFGHNPKTYEAITGVKGSFDKALASAKLLKKNNIDTVVKITQMTKNKDSVSGIKKLADKMGLKYTVSHLAPN